MAITIRIERQREDTELSESLKQSIAQLDRGEYYDFIPGQPIDLDNKPWEKKA